MQTGQTLLSGVLPIVTTPFSGDGRVDLASLTRVVEHILSSGAHGLVYPAIASEFQTLSPEERRVAVEHVLAIVGGRKPTVVGVSSTDEHQSPATLSAQAAKLGAAAVMLMPRMTQSAATLPTVFGDVADACGLPIILQNAPPPLGPALSVEAVLAIAAAVPQIRYVKEETLPCGQRISRILMNSGNLVGVFGGAGGRFVLDELARGALGSMPACEFTNAHVAVYNHFKAGQRGDARALFNRILPLLNLESVFRTPATKYILHEMGLIASPRYRDHNPDLDDADRIELSLILEDMRAWMPQAAI